MKKLLLYSLFSLCSVCAIGQTYADDTDEIDIEVSSEDAQIPVLFQVLGIDTAMNPKNDQIEGSQVFLQQIGDLNRASINVIANRSEVGLFQNGNRNEALLEYDVNTVVTDITQNGNENVVIDYVINPLEDVSLDLQQNGDNLNFERIGTNALTRSLRFIQTDASPSLIIRSFN